MIRICYSNFLKNYYVMVNRRNFEDFIFKVSNPNITCRNRIFLNVLLIQVFTSFKWPNVTEGNKKAGQLERPFSF